jgi:phosphoribosylglycinamide formyltransferase-1
LKVHQAALDCGVKVSGCSVHFVDESIDGGPIIVQKAVKIEEDDSAETLAERILKEEHILLPKAIELFAEGRLKIEGRRVKILKKSD